jgi:hypothetical protein
VIITQGAGCSQCTSFCNSDAKRGRRVYQNDGMIGGDNVHANILANAVRESGDHSAINSW